MSPLFAVLALAVGAPNLKEPPPKGLVGRWQCTAVTISGKADQWQGLEYEFTANGLWILHRDGKDNAKEGWTYKSDPEAGPGAIDLCERPDGVAQPSRYKVDGEILDVSIRTEKGGARPADLGPGDGLQTFTFRRVKSKD